MPRWPLVLARAGERRPWRCWRGWTVERSSQQLDASRRSPGRATLPETGGRRSSALTSSRGVGLMR
eukprot:7018717-Prymnesium_polylepis.1